MKPCGKDEKGLVSLAFEASLHLFFVMGECVHQKYGDVLFGLKADWWNKME